MQKFPSPIPPLQFRTGLGSIIHGVHVFIHGPRLWWADLADESFIGVRRPLTRIPVSGDHIRNGLQIGVIREFKVYHYSKGVKL